MRPSDDVGLTKAFWTAVVQCLERFHQFGHEDATGAVREVRARMLDVPEDGDAALADMIYHSEPWHVAADIAKDDASTLSPAQRETYEEILKRTGLRSVVEARAGRAAG